MRREHRLGFWRPRVRRLLVAILAATSLPLPAASPELDARLAAAATQLGEIRERQFRKQVGAQPAEAGLVRIDLGPAAGEFAFDGLRLMLDGEALFALPPGTVAATSGGLLPLLAQRIGAGPHQLQVDWQLHGKPARRDSFAFTLDDGLGADFELRLATSLLPGEPRLSLTEWQAKTIRQSRFAWFAGTDDGFSRSGYRAGSRDDPRWRRARQLLDSDQPWLAAQALAALEAAAPHADTAALLATAAARCGLVSTAEAALARAVTADRTLMADAVLAVAGLQMADGRPESVLTTLDGLPSKLEVASRNKALLLRARAQFAGHEFAAAARTLQAAEVDPLKLVGAPAGERLVAGLLQYNLGLALIGSGAAERGWALLDRLGRGESAKVALDEALRDRANLSLGLHFLNAGQGATARAMLERIPLTGPYSNRALLGLGWAALGPQGAALASTNGETGTARETPKFVLKAMQRRRLIDCEDYNRRALAPTELCRRLTPLGHAAVPDEASELAVEAWTVWRELASRDARDPAVIEAWALLPYAAARAAALEEAKRLYEAAVTRLETALADNANASVRLSTAPPDLAAGQLRNGGLTPGQSLAADRLVQLEADLAIDGAAPFPAVHRLLGQAAETAWLRAADPEDEGLRSLAAQQQALLTDLLQVRLAEQKIALLSWLASARAGLASLSDPSRSDALLLPGSQP